MMADNGKGNWNENQSIGSVNMHNNTQLHPTKKMLQKPQRNQSANPYTEPLRPIFGPKTITLHRKEGYGFGFTLRHFIVYPPELCNESQPATSDGQLGQLASNGQKLNHVKPMDTVFVKEVRPYGPAYVAGLQTGDRLLSVNGMPVAGTPYNRVVTVIQQAQTPLTLQVVSKECDVLQTFFSEAAHNPETNQRPKLIAALPTPAQMAPTLSARVPNNILAHQSKSTKNNGPRDGPYNRQKEGNGTNSDIIYSDIYGRGRAEPQVPSPIDHKQRGGDEIVQMHHGYAQDNGNGQTRLQSTSGYNPIVHQLYGFDSRRIESAYDTHFPSTQIMMPSDRRESSASATSSIGSYDSGSTLTSDLGDTAIMTRLRKSLEQKQEFLRGASTGQSVSTNGQTGQVWPIQTGPVSLPNPGNDNFGNIRHREFYARPNRLQKINWPPPLDFDMSPVQKGRHDNQENHNSDSNKLTVVAEISGLECSGEVTLNGQGHPDKIPLQPSNTNQNILPPHRLANHIAREQFYNGIQPNQDGGEQQQNVLLENEEICRIIPPPNGLHIVSEITKQFESGRPLSPDGSSVDRTSLYRSELCRLSTTRPVPNVALRRKEFEQKAETSEWKRLSDEDRSSSMEPSQHDGFFPDQSLDNRAQSLARTDIQSGIEKLSNHLLRRKPSRQNSYLEAVKSGGNHHRTDLEQITNQIDHDLSTNSSNSNSTDQSGPVIRPQNDNTLKELKLMHRNQTIITGGGDVTINRRVCTTPPPFDLDDTEPSVYTDHTGQSVSDCKDVEMTSVADSDCFVTDTFVGDADGQQQKSAIRLKAMRPTTLHIPESNVTMRRHKSIIEDDDRPNRRASYLRATANEHSLDSDIENSPLTTPIELPDSISVANALYNLKSAYRPWRRPKLTADIQPLRRIFEEYPPDIYIPPSSPSERYHQFFSTPLTKSSSTSGSKTKGLSYLRDGPIDPSLPILYEGDLNIKLTMIDGKRSPDRTWRSIAAEIRGWYLKLTINREGKSNQSPETSGIIDLRTYQVTEGNYTKRKHVFKLTSANVVGNQHVSTSPQPYSNGTELLLQADNHQDMKLWMDTLSKASRLDNARSEEYLSNFGSQQAEPQRVPATQSIHVSDQISASLAAAVNAAASSKNKKYLGSRSPSGQSPVTKTRKNSQTGSGLTLQHHQSSLAKDGSDKDIGSPKTRTWKGLVARQFRKIQGQPSSPNSNEDPQLPDGASIGVPLAQCPPSEDNEFVPLIVARCTQIIEAKGLKTTGIYRIPGNTANIQLLKDQLNRGFDEQVLNDPKWDDVHVVSSLLKLFIRNLPDALLPSDMYSDFIDADKGQGRKRLQDIQSLLNALPPHCYETLKHLMRHLNRVSQESANNFMDAKNLAIIFGPSVVRLSNETLELVVKDMKHQCLIVESLVSHYDYFFENGSFPLLIDTPDYAINTPTDQTSLLLDNVSKIESRERDGARFVTKFVRKTRKNSHRKSTTSSITPDTLSLDSSTSAESKEQSSARQSTSISTSIQATSITTDDSSKHRLSEDDSNDSPFTDNGSMSLTTVTLTLDDKLRSLRNSSFDSDPHLNDMEDHDRPPNVSPPPPPNRLATVILTKTTIPVNQPLSLGENIPYADESPERPLIQPRSKPVRVQSYQLPVSRHTTRLNSTSSTSPPNSPSADGVPLSSSPSSSLSSSQTSHVDNMPPTKLLATKQSERIDGGGGGVTGGGSVSSDDTDASTTSSNPPIDFEMIREMNRILTTFGRQATKLNRSLSLNYKNHKSECCCNSISNSNSNNNIQGNVYTTTSTANNNNTINNNNNSNSNISNSNNNVYRTSGTMINRFPQSLTKDEKTDKNINKKRQIQDIKNRRYINRSIKRRHTVGGTHDYCTVVAAGTKSNSNPPMNRCQQAGHTTDTFGNNLFVTNAIVRTSSPDLVKDNQDKI